MQLIYQGERHHIPQKQTLTQLQDDILFKSLVSFTNPVENTLQDKLQTQLMSKTRIDTVDTLQEIISEYYQQSGPLMSCNTAHTIW